jgi:hypothetical protein
MTTVVGESPGTGPDGALRAYGTGKRAGFDRKRV